MSHQLLHPIAVAALLCTLAAQAQTVEQRVEIIGTTPVGGVGVDRDRIPANVQTVGENRLRRLQSVNVADALNSAIGSASVNEMQGNPYQLDVNFRGFTASPLLGTPQGLSVFQDGVRVNEPFGDVVNWDLIPRAALASITLLPGSNPLFGLNTLGGALNLETKRGDTHPDTEVELGGGSFGRLSSELVHGRRIGEHGHLLLAASTLDDDGWRDASPSRVRQLFVKTGRSAPGFAWDVALTAGNTRLIGNGPLPESMVEQRREQVYTRPDITENRLAMLAAHAQWAVGASHSLSATVYARRTRSDTLNGDLNDEYDPPAVPESGVENRTHSRQRAEGFVLQSTQRWGGSQLSLGLASDRAGTHFMQTQAEGSFDAERVVVPEGAPQTRAQIAGSTRTRSAYAHALLELGSSWQATLAARWNGTRVKTMDEGRAQLGLPTALDGDARYTKLNPAFGLTWQARPDVTFYAGWSQGNRAPSPIELGCSDPQNACVLPNALQSDPPLAQVVSRTVEAGARGRVAETLRWNASAFRTVNRDDLLFVSNGLASGYFKNFGRTQRQGVELGLSQQAGTFGWQLSYSLLQATYRNGACIVAEGNSTAETRTACTGDDEIEIRPGDRLPGLPRHTLKLGADWTGDASSAGIQLRAQSSQFVRGNENNAHAADGGEFSGSGRIGGFAVIDLTAAWKPTAALELFAKVANLFDRRYATAGLLGRNAFDSTGALLAPADWRQAQFVGPGAPRALWIGLRLAVD